MENGAQAFVMRGILVKKKNRQAEKAIVPKEKAATTLFDVFIITSQYVDIGQRGSNNMATDVRGQNVVLARGELCVMFATSKLCWRLELRNSSLTRHICTCMCMCWREICSGRHCLASPTSRKRHR